MTTEEKIQRLAQLFKQRDEINGEIESILGNISSTKPKRKISLKFIEPKTVKQPKKLSKTSKKGHPITDEIKTKIAQMKADGFNEKVIADQLEVSLATVNRYSRAVAKSAPSKNDEKRYYCRDCKTVFTSKERLLNAECSGCGSRHVDYAVRYGK